MQMNDHDAERVEKKLDRILELLHGDGKSEMGIVQKVNWMWMMIFKWPLYILFTTTGALITLLIQKFTK